MSARQRLLRVGGVTAAVGVLLLVDGLMMEVVPGLVLLASDEAWALVALYLELLAGPALFVTGVIVALIGLLTGTGSKGRGSGGA